jgi:AcrR family transcriptional regulator
MKPFHLASELSDRVDLALKLPKRTRTRHSLIAATAREMERVGYEGLTIDNIVLQARLARGTFYLYFANRSDAAAAVMRAYRALIRMRRPRGGKRLGRYETILRMNRFYVSTYSLNATLLAGVESLIRERPDQALSRDFWNDRWARAVLSDALHRCGEDRTADEPRALLAIRAVLAMADELLREVFVYKSPAFAPFSHDEETVAEVLSIVWHRAVYGVHPEGVDQILPVAQLQQTAADGAQAALLHGSPPRL